MQAGFDDHTKAGRRAISPKWLTDQAKDGFQASSPSCDLINSLQGLVVLGRLSPHFRQEFDSLIAYQNALSIPSNHIKNRNASRCVSSAVFIA
jgi:hypothetical protein